MAAQVPCACLGGCPLLVLCRLREAELMFQEDRVADADRLMRTVVRKNPTYAGNAMQSVLAHMQPMLQQ